MPAIPGYTPPDFDSVHYVKSTMKRIDETELRLETVRTAFEGLTLLQGEKGEAFKVDVFGNVAEILAHPSLATANPLDVFYAVITDDTPERSLFTGIETSTKLDLSRHSIMFDGTNWFNFGPFTGLKGDPGSDADATAAIASLQTNEIDPLKTRVSSVEGRATTLETDLAAAVAVNTTQTADITAVEGRATTLESGLVAVEGRATTLETDLAAAVAVNTTQTADITAVEGRATTLESGLVAVEGRATTLETDLTAAVAVNTTQTADILAVAGRAAVLEENTSNYLLVEGESTVSNEVLWACGASAPIVDRFGIPVPYKSVLFRTSGISYGSHGSLTRMTLDVSNYGLTGAPTLLKTLEFNLVSGGFMQFMEAVPKSMANLIENGGNFLSFGNVIGYNTLDEVIAIPSNLRFRIVLEIFKDEYTSGYISLPSSPGGGTTFMNGSFGGTSITNGNTFIYPNEAEVWAGFFNMNNDIYPIYLINGGQITFTGKVTTGTEAVITFKLQDVGSPNTTTEVAVNTTITNTTDSYTIVIPSQGTTAFNEFLMYTPIGSTVEITDVQVVGSV